MLAVAVLKFLIIFEQGALHFHFALAPTDDEPVPSPAHLETRRQDSYRSAPGAQSRVKLMVGQGCQTKASSPAATITGIINGLTMITNSSQAAYWGGRSHKLRTQADRV